MYSAVFVELETVVVSPDAAAACYSSRRKSSKLYSNGVHSELRSDLNILP